MVSSLAPSGSNGVSRAQRFAAGDDDGVTERPTMLLETASPTASGFPFPKREAASTMGSTIWTKRKR
jgi:hypothetical protein